MVRFLTLEEVDRQNLRVYSHDRLPGIGDRNALGGAGRRRLREARFRECAEQILGPSGNGWTYLPDGEYPGRISRWEMVARLGEAEALAERLRAALAAIDEEDEG